MPDEPVLNWKLTDGVLDGYPYNYYKELLTLGEKWKVAADKFDGYPFIYDYGFRVVPSSKSKWTVSGDVLDGYPHIYYRELIPPYHLPQFESMALSRTDGFVGVGGDLSVTVTALKYIALEDVLVVEVYSSSDARLYFTEVPINQEGKIDSFSCAVPEEFMRSLAVGGYNIKVTVKHSDDEVGTAVSSGYTVNALPEMVIKSVTPATLQKPVTAVNNALSVTYDLSGEKITQITNVFTLAGFTAAETLKNAELLTITSTTQSSRIDTLNFIFNVSDADFKLKYFKFQFGNYTASTRLQISLDGKVYTDATLTFPNWHGYVFPDGLPLAQGSHTIKFYCPPSYFYAYQTSAKPTVPGMAITSSTVYAMEMEYTVSTSGIAGERKAAITVDDSIAPGDYPLTVESAATLDGYGEYNFGQTTENLLTVLEAQIRNPSIGAVTVSKSGRYVGCETDVVIAASGLANVLGGDVFSVRLMDGAGVTAIYEHSDSLTQDTSTFSHTILASAFASLGVGSYFVTVKIIRGEFSEEKSTAYSVIAAPTLVFVTIAPDTVQLPIIEPLSLSSRWSVTWSGINSVQGSVTLDGTDYSFGVNATDTDFTAVISNIIELTAGSYSLTANLTAISDEYGSVNLNGTYSDLLTVLSPILEPEIGAVTLDVSGRYAGSETDVAVTASGLANILNVDGAVVRLYYGSTVFYEHTEILSDGDSSFQHTVPQSVFSGLDVGDYVVRVAIAGILQSEAKKKFYTALSLRRPGNLYPSRRTASNFRWPHQ